MTYLILTTIFFGVALIFIKLSTNKIYPLFGNVFFSSRLLLFSWGH